MASDNMKHRRLQELGDSDFEIADGQPDIRGWDVKNESGQKVGEVQELILDAQQRKVRYMVVELDDDALDLDDDREVLIPIGLAQLHEKDDDVIIPGISIEQLRSLPAYDEDHLTPDVESAICSTLGRRGASGIATSGNDADFYQHEHFNDENLYRLRLPASSSDRNNSHSGRGIQFYDKMEQSGSEVEGYLGGEGIRSERPAYDAGRTGIYSEEEIEDEATVPVNRNSLDDAEELRADRDRNDTNLRNPDSQSERDKSRGSSL